MKGQTFSFRVNACFLTVCMLVHAQPWKVRMLNMKDLCTPQRASYNHWCWWTCCTRGPLPRSLPCPRWGRGPAAPNRKKPQLNWQRTLLQERSCSATVGTNGPHIGVLQAWAYNEAGSVFGNSRRILRSTKRITKNEF